MDINSPITSPCQEKLHPQALAGIRHFNRQEFFEAHEALELAWREEPREIRNLYQAILQVGVAYYHIQNENYSGAVKLFQRSQAWLELFPAICLGLDLDRFREDFQRVQAETFRRGPQGLKDFPAYLFKPIVFYQPAE